MEKQIRDIIGQHVGGTYEAKQKAVNEILLLFSPEVPKLNSYNVEKFKRMEVAIKIILTNIELLGTRQNKEYTISKQDINTLKDALK